MFDLLSLKRNTRAIENPQRLHQMLQAKHNSWRAAALPSLNGRLKRRTTTKDVREEVHSVGVVFDALLPVLREVPQHFQGPHADGDVIFVRPDLHGNEHHARVELLFEDLPLKREKREKREEGSERGTEAASQGEENDTGREWERSERTDEGTRQHTGKRGDTEQTSITIQQQTTRQLWTPSLERLSY